MWLLVSSITLQCNIHKHIEMYVCIDCKDYNSNFCMGSVLRKLILTPEVKVCISHLIFTRIISYQKFLITLYFL